MTNREKVIRGLWCCKTYNCTECPYLEVNGCIPRLYDHAIALLRKQEPDETRFVHRYSRSGVYVDLLLHCEKCDGTIENHTILNYCPWCGRKVKWND